MPLRTLFAVAMLLLTLASRAALACSVCGCGDPLLSASDPAAVNGSLRLELDGEYLSVRSANDAAPALTDTVEQVSSKLSAVYSPLSGLSFIGILPVAHKQLSTAGITDSSLAGLGDIELGARYTLIDLPSFAAQRVQSVAVSLGTSAPTGENGAKVDGERVDEHGQLGTGSWGPYVGLHYRVEQGPLTGFVSLSERIRTENSHGYRYGVATLWSAHGQYFVMPQVALDLGVDGRYAAQDKDNGATVVSTGGAVLALAPGVYWNVAGGVWVTLRAQFPVFEDLYGVQSVGPTGVAGVEYLVF